MSEEEFGNEEKTFKEPLERAIIRRRSEFYADWIASHPILWGWILFVMLNTVAVLRAFFLLWGDFPDDFTIDRSELWAVGRPFWWATIPIWWASVAWAKRLSWQQWIAFAAALVVMLAGVLFGALMAASAHWSPMSSGPSGRPSRPYLYVLLPFLGALPGLCWVVAVLRRKKRNL